MFDLIPINGGITAVNGVYCDGIHAGLKSDGALDIAFIYSDTLMDVEAIFTRNTFKAAPIKYFLKHNIGNKTNFVLINTKNANAMTGDKGLESIYKIKEELIKKFNFIQNPIFSSTGIIGQYLPTDTIINSLQSINIQSRNNNAASNAILTTDTINKEIAIRVDLDNGSFVIGAMAKGAGMINPSMATMLCFIITDANIPVNDMKEILCECNKNTFNAISVDGDTSTNDSVFLFTNRKSNMYDKRAFTIALEMVMKKLAIDILKDGEGSSKVVAFEVKNAKSKEEAMKCAKALSNSLLIKTAIFGSDPNWGRIASTIGATGIEADASTLQIYIGNVLIYDCQKIHFDKEEMAKKVMESNEFKITCDIGLGNSNFTAYGCDLGHKYVEINSNYRS